MLDSKYSFSACPAGYFGQNCSVPCLPDTYGQQCKLECKCTGGKLCDPKAGCKCKAGYSGEKCDKGKTIIIVLRSFP